MPSPDSCQSECLGDSFWSCLPGGVGEGRHSERSGSCGCLWEGSKDFQRCHDWRCDMAEWETNADGRGLCRHSSGEKNFEGQGGNAGVDWVSHQARGFSPEESKMQKLLWEISPLFNLFMLPAVKDMGNCKCFLDDDVSTSNYIISICWLESWWRRAEGRTLKYLPFFTLLKDPTV